MIRKIFLRSSLDIYLSAIYFRAIFVNKRIYIDEASSNLCETLYMWNEDTMRSEARNRKKGKKENPFDQVFGIYLKIEYPCSKNAIPLDLRNQDWNFLFSFPSNGRAQFRTHDYTLSPRHLFYFIFYSRKSFVRSSLSSNEKKKEERKGEYFKTEGKKEKGIKLNTSA